MNANIQTSNVAREPSVTDKIKILVANGNMVKFVRFFEGEFIYATEDGFEFPVPVAAAEGATFLANERAMAFMKHIRKHLEMLQNARQEVMGA